MAGNQNSRDTKVNFNESLETLKLTPASPPPCRVAGLVWFGVRVRVSEPGLTVFSSYYFHNRKRCTLCILI